MPYVQLADIESRIPPAFLTQALDDDGDGEADAWDSVAAQAAAEVDGHLGGRFTVPFTEPYPAIVVLAAQTLACENLYRRRGVANDQNPFYMVAEAVRRKLEEIAKGNQPLAPTANRAKPSGTLISEPAPTHSATGRRMT